MTFLFSRGRLPAFHDYLRVIGHLEEHLTDRLEQRQAVPAELVILGHDQDVVKKIIEAGLDPKMIFLGLV
jgi:predicted nuclease of predicted toxin-antitoxin system